MRALYVCSDFLRLIMYHIIGYRVAVIRTNLRNSFPEMSEKERMQIEREFYKHLCDLIVESIKYFHITQNKAEHNYEVHNAELLQELYKKGKSVVIVGGHYASWERYALNATRDVPHYTAALYTTIHSKIFNRKMTESRSHFGLHMVPIEETRTLFEHSKTEPIAVIFGADQCPRNPERAYWLTFLHQETGVQFGAEKYAREYNCAVVYGQLDKTPRKTNSITYRLICEDPATLPEGKITELHTKLLEEKIIDKPAYWLWSHKRWKHKRPKGMPLH